MMTSTPRRVLALLVAGPMAFTNPAMGQDQSPEGSGPRIVRLDLAVEAPSDDVTVFRGSAVHPVPVARKFPPNVGPRAGVDLVGGDTVWLVDHKSGLLIGCVLVGTIDASDPRDIRCEHARLN